MKDISVKPDWVIEQLVIISASIDETFAMLAAMPDKFSGLDVWRMKFQHSFADKHYIKAWDSYTNYLVRS
jgi:hypothetical protein